VGNTATFSLKDTSLSSSSVGIRIGLFEWIEFSRGRVKGWIRLFEDKLGLLFV
jgi:hypothetical protein